MESLLFWVFQFSASSGHLWHTAGTACRWVHNWCHLPAHSRTSHCTIGWNKNRKESLVLGNPCSHCSWRFCSLGPWKIEELLNGYQLILPCVLNQVLEWRCLFYSSNETRWMSILPCSSTGGLLCWSVLQGGTEKLQVHLELPQYCR